MQRAVPGARTSVSVGEEGFSPAARCAKEPRVLFDRKKAWFAAGLSGEAAAGADQRPIVRGPSVPGRAPGLWRKFTVC